MRESREGPKPRGATDRRREPRTRIAGTVVVCSGDRYVGTYLVENLSAGGALLVGSLKMQRGAPLRLLLCLPLGRRIALAGEFCRSDTNGANEASAVRFCDVPEQTRSLLREIVLTELSPSRMSLRALAGGRR